MSRITPRAKPAYFQPGLSDKTFSLMAEQVAACLGSDKARRQIQRRDEYRKADEYFRNPRRTKNETHRK